MDVDLEYAILGAFLLTSGEPV